MELPALAICSEPHSRIRIYCELFPNRSDRNSIFHSKKSPSPGFSASGRNSVLFVVLQRGAAQRESDVNILGGYSKCSAPLSENAEVELIATPSSKD